MTSTHVDPSATATATPLAPSPVPAVVDPLVNVSPVTANDDIDRNDGGSFSDPFDEAENAESPSTDRPEAQAALVDADDDDDDDDYAMTFESDADDDASKQGETLSPTSALPTESTSGNPPPYSNPAIPAATNNGNTSDPALPSNQDPSNGEIDIQQLLDNITASAELNASNANTVTTIPAGSATFPPNPPTPSVHASLPPRPQVPQSSAAGAAYASQDDVRQFYAAPPGYTPSPVTPYGAPGAPGSFISTGAPGTSTDSRNILLPPPPPASFNPSASILTPPVMNAAVYAQSQRVASHDGPTKAVDLSELPEDAEVQWSPPVQKLYDEFLADERMYVAEGLWDRFPAGSRLFIGNLPTEKVTKRDLFSIFHHYGRLAQISIKQAYGFVQFHDTAACYTALEREQGQEARGRKMHLEISKPQRNTRGGGGGSNTNSAQTTSHRSRSPDYSRGGRGTQPPSRNGGYERYEARPGAVPRDNEFRAPMRIRDDYRPGRSPSPARGAYRGRDEYSASRGRDYYDGRERRRSRSRSPYDRRESARYRDRSPSPRTREAEEDLELKIPRRDPRDVPDVQIILMDELDRGFVTWVEGEIRSRGVKTEVMFLSPRLPLAAVIRRQILEGVLAVAQLDRRSQDTSKIPLQVFDRQGGANNVRFDEYQDLEPRIAAELVVRAKQTQSHATPVYGQPQYPASQPYQPPPPAAAATTPNLANLVGQLDNATLQKLLSTLNTTVPPQQTPQVDLAGILGGLGQQPVPSAPPQPGYHAAAQSNQFAQATAPNLASIFGNGVTASPSTGSQSAQQVQNIMAQLAKFRQ